jgi:hypothetical protein
MAEGGRSFSEDGYDEDVGGNSAAILGAASTTTTVLAQSELMRSLRKENNMSWNIAVGFAVPIAMRLGKQIAESLWERIKPMFVRFENNVLVQSYERRIYDHDVIFPFNCNRSLQQAITCYMRTRFNLHPKIGNVSMLPSLESLFCDSSSFTFNKAELYTNIQEDTWITLPVSSEDQAATMGARVNIGQDESLPEHVDTVEFKWVLDRLDKNSRAREQSLSSEDDEVHRGVNWEERASYRTIFMLRSKRFQNLDVFLTNVTRYAREAFKQGTNVYRLLKIHPQLGYTISSQYAGTVFPMKTVQSQEDVNNMSGLFFSQKQRVLAKLSSFKDKTGYYSLPGASQKMVIMIRGGYGVGKTTLCEHIAQFMDRNLVFVPAVKNMNVLNSLLCGQITVTETHAVGTGDFQSTCHRLSCNKSIFVFEETNKDNIYYEFLKPRDNGDGEGAAAPIEFVSRSQRMSKSSTISSKSSSSVSASRRRYVQDDEDFGSGSRLREELESCTKITRETFLNFLDGCCTPTDLMVIIVTNLELQDFDEAMTRPGRLDLIVEMEDTMSIPSAMELVSYQLRRITGVPLSASEVTVLGERLEKAAAGGARLMPCGLAHLCKECTSFEGWLHEFDAWCAREQHLGQEREKVEKRKAEQREQGTGATIQSKRRK